MTKRRLTAEERKRTIVQAALPLFARKGFAETTTKDLARAAGISEPLLYRHFPSKEALYLEIQNFSCQGLDPVSEKMMALKPSTETLVRLVHYLMRALVLGQPTGMVAWDMRHRLMLNSFLADGGYARLIYKNRFDDFCERIEASLAAGIRSRDVQQGPLTLGNRARFAHHMGAWLALVHLPESPAIDYRMTRQELLDQATRFALAGMGVTDRAVVKYYQPAALESFFATMQG